MNNNILQVKFLNFKPTEFFKDTQNFLMFADWIWNITQIQRNFSPTRLPSLRIAPLRQVFENNFHEQKRFFSFAIFKIKWIEKKKIKFSFLFQ